MKPVRKFSGLVEEQDNLTEALQIFSCSERQGALLGLLAASKTSFTLPGKLFLLPCIFCWISVRFLLKSKQFLFSSSCPLVTYFPSFVPSFLSSCGSIPNSPQPLTSSALKPPVKFPSHCSFRASLFPWHLIFLLISTVSNWTKTTSNKISYKPMHLLGLYVYKGMLFYLNWACIFANNPSAIVYL